MDGHSMTCSSTFTLEALIPGTATLTRKMRNVLPLLQLPLASFKSVVVLAWNQPRHKVQSAKSAKSQWYRAFCTQQKYALRVGNN